VYIANEVNQRHHIDHQLQFDFLINIVRKKKRFSKWYKLQRDEDIDAVMEYYEYSRDKARQVVDLLTEDQITQIRKSQSKGGINDGINRHND
jgi:ATP-dependent DNA ligase